MGLDELRFLGHIVADNVVAILHPYVVNKALAIHRNVWYSRGLNPLLYFINKLIPNILRITLANESLLNGLSGMPII